MPITKDLSSKAPVNPVLLVYEGPIQHERPHSAVLDASPTTRQKKLQATTLPLVSREWKNGSNSSYNCTPFLHSLLTKGKQQRGPFATSSPMFSKGLGIEGFRGSGFSIIEA